MSVLLGLPVEVTNIGLVHPIKIKDHNRFSLFTWTVEKTKKSLNKENSDESTLALLIEEYSKESVDKAGIFLYHIRELLIMATKEKNVEFIPETYSFKIGDSTTEEINGELVEFESERFLNETNFDEFAERVRKQNIVFEKRYHTHLFQKRIDEELEFERRKNKGSSMETIFQVLSTKMGVSYEFISEMTYMQAISNYQRIMCEKAYDTSVKLKAGGFDCEIDDYSKELDLFKHPEDSLYQKKKGSELTSSFGV